MGLGREGEQGRKAILREPLESAPEKREPVCELPVMLSYCYERSILPFLPAQLSRERTRNKVNAHYVSGPHVSEHEDDMDSATCCPQGAQESRGGTAMSRCRDQGQARMQEHILILYISKECRSLPQRDGI